ncbi:MAG TPA: hypothetical protein VNO74_11190 [Methylomirabilota bacterium]|nr:hypothetical protein [Methylomirabilota bacterium]
MERMFADFDAWLVAMTVALMLSSVLSAMLVGREQAVADQSDIAGTVCFIILVSFGVYVTSTNQTAALYQ